MSAYKDALRVSTDTQGPRRDLALEVLASGEAVVVLEGRLALRPLDGRIYCEVITNLPRQARTPDALNAEMDSVKELLDSSTIRHATRGQLVEWLVVEDYGTGWVKVWPPKG